MQLERQLKDAIKSFENILLPEKLRISQMLKDLFVPEFIGIDITENKINDIKFYYIPVENKRSELLSKNSTLKKTLFNGMGNLCAELSPIMDESIQLFDFSMPYYGQDNISERIIFKCKALNSTREEIISNCIRATDYHQAIPDTKKICSIIQQNVKTKKHPLHLFGFDIDLENMIIRHLKTYFSLFHFKSDTSYKGVRVDEQALTSCREIICLFGLGLLEKKFSSIYQKLGQEGAFLDFIGVNYTTELSKSLKTYFTIDKIQIFGKERGFDLKKVCESENEQAVIEEIRLVMEKLQYIPAFIGLNINENTIFDTKLYFEKMA